MSWHGLTLDNSFVRELPGDPESGNFRRQVLGACYSRVDPTPVAGPTLVAHSPDVAEMVGLAPNAAGDDRFPQVFSGNLQLDGMEPYAMCYGGHQFGNWARQLGDGRAISLGEARGANGQRWELQLKGAGPTPYSRMGDGRAVLRSSVREFLCSEAMHHLGVPSTRALSLTTTGDDVVRDMFYDGHAKPEPGAVVCRVAPSFIRFGNFQILASRGDVSTLTALTDHTLRRHFPELGERTPDSVLEMFLEVSRRTALMVAHWMRVGFVHGVMNTDNMSVLGLTIDYGPYGWLDNYDEDWTPNTTDAGNRRYRYGYQPAVAHWNLARFAESLVPLIGSCDPLEQALDEYATTYDTHLRTMTAAKLGLLRYEPATDDALVKEMTSLMSDRETDMTIFFRRLADVPVAEDCVDRARPLADAFYVEPDRPRLARWLETFSARVRADGADPAARGAQMRATNPIYVLRNYVAQEAIDEAEQGDFTRIKTLLEVLRRPYEDQPGRENFAAKRPDWARSRPGCSMLSCSS